VGVPGQAWSGVGDVPPPGAASSPASSRHWRRCGCYGGSCYARGGPRTTRNQECCSVARLTGGEGAPALRLGAPGSPRDLDSRSRNLPFPAYFSRSADGSRMLRAVSQTRRPVAIRITDLGEPRRLPRVPAKVPRLNRQGSFALGRGNASSCPFSDLAPRQTKPWGRGGKRPSKRCENPAFSGG